ncbi:MAG: Hpt domain-containing protein, partial [Spirochaetota bacterium]
MNTKLLELIRKYDEGDLVSAAGIIEEADALTEVSEGDAADLYREIADSLRAAVRGEDETVDDARREQWITQLSGAPEPTGASEPGDQDEPGDQATPSIDDGVVLSFLGSAVGHLSTIVDMLKRYRAGDLTLATEILAETQQLASDPATPDEALPTIRRIRDLFFEHVRAGTEDGGGEPVEAPDDDDIDQPAVEPPDEIDVEATEHLESDPVVQSTSETRERRATVPDLEPAAPHDVPLDDVDVVTSFIQESVDHLDDIEHRVLNLEDEYTDDLVNSIFRSIHTIKGVASFVGFSYVSETSHELETLLDDVRNGQQPITEELVTVLLDGTDVISQIVHNIEKQVSGGAPAILVEESFGHRQIVARARALRTGEEFADVAAQAISSASEPEEERPLSDRSSAPAGTVDLSDAPVVTREMIDAFIEESTDLLDQVEQELLRAEHAPIEHATVDQIFRSIHTVKGNAGFFWFTRVEQRCMAMESALDEYRQAGESIDREAAGHFLDSLDTIRESVRAVAAAAESTRADALDGERVPDQGTGDRTSAQTESSDVDQVDGSDALGEILVQMGEITEESL